MIADKRRGIWHKLVRRLKPVLFLCVGNVARHFVEGLDYPALSWSHALRQEHDHGGGDFFEGRKRGGLLLS